MNFPFFIAKRYLFSSKTKRAVNIISFVSMTGVIIGTSALVLLLSVFNGFEDLLLSMYNSFDPHIKITSNEVFEIIKRKNPSIVGFSSTTSSKPPTRTTPAAWCISRAIRRRAFTPSPPGWSTARCLAAESVALGSKKGRDHVGNGDLEIRKWWGGGA